MNYQYQQMPQQPMINPLELKKQKQAKVFAFCDKLNNAIGDNKLVRPLVKSAEIISYILVAVCFILSLVFLITDSSHPVINFITYIPFVFSIVAVCNKKILPLAINLSFCALLYLGYFISCIITFAQLGRYGASAPAYFIMQFIFIIIELAAFVFATVFIWKAFAASLNPSIPVYPTYAMPQQPVAPVAPVPQAAPVQPVTPAEAPVTVPVQEAAPQVTYCPKCGTQNTAGSGFCKSCGTKLN